MAEQVDTVVLGIGVGGDLIYAYPTFYRGVGEAVHNLGPHDVHTAMR